jgi:SAM-dependent methyltransferase
VIVISAEGKNSNIKRAAQILGNKRIPSFFMSLAEGSPCERLLFDAGVLNGKAIAKDPRTSFHAEIDEFVPFERCVTFCRMLTELFLSEDIDRQNPWTKHGGNVLADAMSIDINEITGRRLISIIASYDGFPAAISLENAFVETGRASVNISDPGNFRHGRFMLLAEQSNDAGCILIGTKNTDWMAGGYKSLINVPTITIETSLSGGDAALELMLRSIAVFHSIQVAHPNHAQVKPWIRPLCDPPLQALDAPVIQAAQPSKEWLRQGPFGEAYLPARYYRKLLKTYSVQGVSDTDMLSTFVKQSAPNDTRVLELGAGDGRATEILLSNCNPSQVCLVDLSQSMCEALGRFKSKVANLQVVCRDIIDFIEHYEQEFDHIVSLWSLSHAIHRRLLREGMISGAATVERAFKRLFCNVLAPKGTGYIVHFDTLSTEQKISIKERGRIQPIFIEGRQSPSKLLLDAVLKSLKDRGHLSFSVKHLHGDPISFSNLDEALEVYMNFHMEGIFNHSEIVGSVIKSLSASLEACKDIDNMITVRPSWFVYEIVRS